MATKLITAGFDDVNNSLQRLHQWQHGLWLDDHEHDHVQVLTYTGTDQGNEQSDQVVCTGNAHYNNHLQNQHHLKNKVGLKLYIRFTEVHN